MKIFLLAVIFSLGSISLYGQFGKTPLEYPCEIITKGKKQGLFDGQKGEWIISLDKHRIVEIIPNYYAIINLKANTVKGVFKNDLYHLESAESTEALMQLYQYDYISGYRFEEFFITADGHGCGHENFVNVVSANKKGVILTKEYVIEAKQFADTTVSTNLYISKKEDPSKLKVFENVLWRFLEDRLYLLQLDKNSEYVNLSIYDLSPDGLGFGAHQSIDAVLTEDGSSDFEKYVYWMNNNDFIPMISEENKEVAEANRELHRALFLSDFVNDSAQSYNLVQKVNQNGLFVADNGAYLCTEANGFFEIYPHKKYDLTTYEYGYNCYAAIQMIGQNLVIHEYYPSESVPVYDLNSGEGLYDENGDPIYEERSGKCQSGVWNFSKKEWIVEPKYAIITQFNDRFVALNLEYITDDSGRLLETKESVDIYDREGNMLKTFQGNDIITVLQYVYDADSAEQIVDSYFYYLTKEDSSMIVRDGVFFSDSDVITEYKDEVLKGTFNEDLKTFVSTSNGDLKLNVFAEELGVISYPVIYDFMGIGITNFDYGYKEYIASNENNQLEINGGVERFGDYSIIRNKTNTYSDEIMELDPETGMILYDEYDNYYVTKYFRKGQYNTGLWNNKKSDWAIPPVYSDIILTNIGYTAEQVEESFSEEEGRFTLDTTKITYHILNHNFDELEKLNYSPELFNDPFNFCYFGKFPKVNKVIQQPKDLDKDIWLTTGRYYWVEDEEGYSMYASEVERIEALIQGADWLHEYQNILYYIKDDSLYFRSRMGEVKNVIAQNLANQDFSIFHTDSFLQIIIGNDTSYYWNFEMYDFSEVNAPEDLNWTYPYLNISRKDNIINVITPDNIALEFYDDYDNYVEVSLKDNDDLIWKKIGNKWGPILSAAHITPTPVGYYIDPNYFEKRDTWGEGPSNEIEMGYYLDLNLKKIDGLDTISYYNRTAQLGAGYVISFSDADQVEWTMYYKNGPKELIEGMGYFEDLGGDKYLFHQIDPYTGSETFDNDGYPVVKEYIFK